MLFRSGGVRRSLFGAQRVGRDTLLWEDKCDLEGLSNYIHPLKWKTNGVYGQASGGAAKGVHPVLTARQIP